MRKKICSEQSETLKKVLCYLKRYWFFLALSFGLAAITVASTLYIPLLTGDAVDCVIGKGLDTDMPDLLESESRAELKGKLAAAFSQGDFTKKNVKFNSNT